MPLARVQRAAARVTRLADERAVFRRVVRRDGIGDPGSGLVPRVFGDFGDRRFLTARQIADDEIRSRILALLGGRGLPALTGGCRLLRGRLGLRRRRRAASSTAPAASACSTAAATPPASTARSRAALVIREPCGRLFGDSERAHLLNRRHLAIGQRHDAHRVARLVVVAGAFFAALATPGAPSGGLIAAAALVALALFVGLGRDDREDDVLAVGRDDGRRPARVFQFLPASQVLDDELSVFALSRQGIREPLSIVRQPRALNRSPGFDDVVGERTLRRRLRGERPLPPLSTDEQGAAKKEQNPPLVTHVGLQAFWGRVAGIIDLGFRFTSCAKRNTRSFPLANCRSAGARRIRCRAAESVTSACPRHRHCARGRLARPVERALRTSRVSRSATRRSSRATRSGQASPWYSPTVATCFARKCPAPSSSATPSASSPARRRWTSSAPSSPRSS